MGEGLGVKPSRCPVPGCAHPYLTWHHFGDEEKVALCLTHAAQADEGAVGLDRLRALVRANEAPPDRPAWRQRPVLARVAGNFFYEVPILLRLGWVTCIGFGRDDNGVLQLDVRMPTASGQRRPVLAGGFWEVPPEAAEVTCPRSGRLIDIAYPNGDRFRAELTEVHNAGALQMRFGTVARWAYRVEFPVTLLQIAMNVAGTDLELGPHHTGMGGPQSEDCFISHQPVAIDIPLDSYQLAALFPHDPAL